jgi:hypothetical protein
MKQFQNRQPDQASGGSGSLRWASACPLCSAEYSPEEARIVSEKEGAFLVHTNCKKCGSSVVATLVANQMGLSSVGLVTDLTFDDLCKFKESESISTDDLLQAYQMFQSDDHVKYLREYDTSDEETE